MTYGRSYICQTQTHAQKNYEKVGRHLRGLRKDRKKLMRLEHRLDEDMVQLCQLANNTKNPNRHVDPTLVSRLLLPLSLPSKAGVSMLAVEQQQKSPQEELHQDSAFEPASPCRSTTSATIESDIAMDLTDFEDSCLDFLIEVLNGGDVDGKV